MSGKLEFIPGLRIEENDCSFPIGKYFTLIMELMRRPIVNKVWSGKCLNILLMIVVTRSFV